jgi:hypothetical protein
VIDNSRGRMSITASQEDHSRPSESIGYRDIRRFCRQRVVLVLLDGETQTGRKRLTEDTVGVDSRSNDRLFEGAHRLLARSYLAQSGAGPTPFSLVEIAQRIAGGAGDLHDGGNQIGRRDVRCEENAEPSRGILRRDDAAERSIERGARADSTDSPEQARVGRGAANASHEIVTDLDPRRDIEPFEAGG